MGLTAVKDTAFSVAQLAALGVRRISLGSSLSRAALGYPEAQRLMAPP